MDYTTIAASIEQARADIKVQIDDLRERDEALEQSLTWAAIAYGIDTDANGEPITVEGEAEPSPETLIERKSKPTPEGKRSRLHWPTVFEWVAAAKADGTFSGERLVETFGGNARNWKRECAKLGLTLPTGGVVAAEKLPKHAFDQQAARDAVAVPPTGPVKPVSIMPLAATAEPKPRDAGYVSVGQVVAAAGDL